MPRNYDLVAPLYPLLERAAFGNALNEARNSLAGPVVEAETALLIGEGNGRFLAECLRRKRGGSITVVDSSAKMLVHSLARAQRVQYDTILEVVHADFQRWPRAAPSFDVIVTHFFLDLFRPESQRRVIAKLTQLANPETLWINVDFRPVLETRMQRAIEWMQYRFDRVVSGIEAECYHDPAGIIEEFGWKACEERSFCNAAVIASLLQRTACAKAERWFAAPQFASSSSCQTIP